MPSPAFSHIPLRMIRRIDHGGGRFPCAEMSFALFAFLALLLLSFTAWAQQAPELNEVVVTATRIDSPILESPSLVTVITQQGILDSGAADLSGVLAQQSGIVVNDYGPQGQGKTVSIRGSTSSQVLVLVDGIRLNSSFDGTVDLSRIPDGQHRSRRNRARRGELALGDRRAGRGHQYHHPKKQDPAGYPRHLQRQLSSP